MKTISAFLLFLLIFTGRAGAADQNSINEQLKQGGIIHLPAGAYTLTDSVILQSNTILEGEPGTVITIPDHAGWADWKPLISGISVQNVTVRNLEINANSDGNKETQHGKGFYNIIHVIDCDNVQVYNCTFHDGLGDGLRTKTSTNIKFYNNLVYCSYLINTRDSYECKYNKTFNLIRLLLSGAWWSWHIRQRQQHLWNR